MVNVGVSEWIAMNETKYQKKWRYSMGRSLAQASHHGYLIG
jgi:hypothetical protein